MPPPMQPPPPPAHQQQLRHWQHLQHPNQPHPQVILNCHYESLLLRNSPVTPMLACLLAAAQVWWRPGGAEAAPPQQEGAGGRQGDGFDERRRRRRRRQWRRCESDPERPRVRAATFPAAGMLLYLFRFYMFQCVPKIFFCMYHNSIK